jgi:tryptophan-rich sensory protein
MTTPQHKHEAHQALALIGWLALTFCAAATGAFVDTGDWYASLVKPPWHPPGWLFGPVWTALYFMMAFAAWMVWLRGGWPSQRRALSIYIIQLLLNALWTPLFFGLQRPDLAFANILLLIATLYTTLIVFWHIRKTAAILLIPYALWTTFATILNFTLWQLNIETG